MSTAVFQPCNSQGKLQAFRRSLVAVYAVQCHLPFL